MKNLVLYDSLYGNTKLIAEAIGKALGSGTEVKHVSAVSPSSLSSYETVYIGSPTHAGRPTPALKEFLDSIPAASLSGVCFAAFDTGIPKAGQGLFLKTVISILGYASPHIAKSIEAKGAKQKLPPHTFFVVGKEGPLEKSQLEAVKEWLKSSI